MKVNGNGQAAILTDANYAKIRRQFKSDKYKLLFDLAWYTGERWGALVKLEIEDVYQPNGEPRDEITFKARTRKASPDGKRKTRQIPVHSVLKEILANYKPSKTDSQYLFPNRNGESHIKLRTADWVLRQAVARAGLAAKGISTHSTRRSFITKLHQHGTDVYTIQKITGHKDLKALGHYIEIGKNVIKGAIEAL